MDATKRDAAYQCKSIFCTVDDYAGKTDVIKDCWSPKSKLGVTMYFSEIIE